ncbi:NAD-dependent epimerase/dehydratase family protein [Flagellimonas alvinocaridis]|uniref:NAD-dependent epimerase/dehydratase family protein n=1 Tax=Flagellimonas alvinocaridis TaxID=2530200 RepID=A0A4S8RQK8_9FLAO|nr:NAD(P)H-binding protein [Allomuricauda alvinocaridis]THV60953.1 NAD-dependent epimerase/dehydratase family protein [Allomuricauda alvinocaridis]
MNKKIGVLGCGWLGFPLARQLAKNSYDVHGSTTSKDKMDALQMDGITPFQIELSETGIKGDIQKFLSNISILIINIPPRLRSKNAESYIEKVKLLHAEIRKSGVSKIIFVSSTSVYGDVKGNVTELTPPIPNTESGKQLLACENLLMGDTTLHTTVIRFGGLIGPQRHPVTMLSGKQNLTNGDDPVNLIHLDDCILMISTIIQNEYWGEIFNGVYPLHPKKRDYYVDEAKKREIPPPHYQNNALEEKNKVVLSILFLGKGHSFTTSITT